MVAYVVSMYTELAARLEVPMMPFSSIRNAGMFSHIKSGELII